MLVRFGVVRVKLALFVEGPHELFGGLVLAVAHVLTLVSFTGATATRDAHLKSIWPSDLTLHKILHKILSKVGLSALSAT